MTDSRHNEIKPGDILVSLEDERAFAKVLRSDHNECLLQFVAPDEFRDVAPWVLNRLTMLTTSWVKVDSEASRACLAGELVKAIA